MVAIFKTFLATDHDQHQSFAYCSVIFSDWEQSRTNAKFRMGSNQEVIEKTESMIGEDDVKPELINSFGSPDGDKCRRPFNPNAFEFVPPRKSDKTGSESVFVFNPKASEFVSLSSTPTRVDVNSGKLFVEEDCNSKMYVDENGNDAWFFFNPPTSEYVPLNTANGMASGSFEDGVEDGYEPSFWNEKASECQLVFNPKASEFVPSYKDSSSENDRGQQFVDVNYFEDQQDLIQPVYPGSDQQMVYFEHPENYQGPIHPMIPTADQCLNHHTSYPINDVPYNMVSWQSQQPHYFPDESNEIDDWSTVNINPDPRTHKTFFHQMYSDNNAGFMKNEPLPQGEEYYYSDTVSVPNSQSEQSPPPFPQKPTTPENTPVTLTPLYALIGVQPNSHRSNRHVKPAIRRMMPIPRRSVPVESNLGNQSTYCQQSVASQPYHVMEPLPVPTQSQVCQGQHYQRYTNKPPAFSAPVKIVIPNVPGDAQTPNGYPSLIPCILPQNYPWVHSTPIIEREQSFQNWQ